MHATDKARPAVAAVALSAVGVPGAAPHGRGTALMTAYWGDRSGSQVKSPHN